MAELAIPVALALIDKVIIILQQNFHRQTRVKDDVEKAQNCLKRMEAYLADTSEHIDEGTRVCQIRVREIQDLAYEIEDALDKFMLQVPHHIHSNIASQTVHKAVHYFPTRNAGKELSTEINGIEKKVRLITALDALHNQAPAQSRPSSSSGEGMTHYYHVLEEEEEIVGFEEHEEKLLAQLMEENSSLLTISIVGPGGSGKTTLAKKVFDNKRVQEFFDCQAWVDVPRAFVPLKVLLNILSKIEAKGQKEPVIHGENPKDKLRLLLKDKRFLVVLDNVWNRTNLKCVVDALQLGFNGSRIIITTPNGASISSEPYVHDLSVGLPWKKAKYLFCKKVFQSSEGSCPFELDDWAQQILKRCEGLPLAISAVGTYLSTKPKTPVEWKNFHNSLGSEIRPDSNLSVISRILQPSYKDLPTHLKSCFLYFSIFPEDYSIGRQRLIRLWIAEGFVKSKRGMTMEQVAEGYLNELVGRNLVHTSAREIDGRVRSCRVLNLVRDFIISKAENFISVLDQTGTSGISGEKIRRLSIHNADIKLLGSRYDLSHIRTLLLFQQQRSHSVLEKVVERSRYLRVLDLQGVPLEDFPNSVLALTLLKYLSLRETNIKTVPESIKNLARLETLDLKHTQVTTLPKEIYELHSMRHLLVYRYDVQNYVKFGDAQGVEVSQSMLSAANIGALSSLQKLSLMKVKNNKKLIKALGRLTDLRKLGLTDLERQDGRDLCLAIQKMKHLSTLDVRSTSVDEYLELDHMQSGSPSPLYLERLYLKGSLERLPRWIPELNSLAKIGLKWSKLNAEFIANPLDALQGLPNLMHLELVDYYQGEVLKFITDTFKKLKILHIEQFEGLHKMEVQSGAMPMLEKLTMCKCRNLKFLPAFGPDDLKSLEELLLYDMHKEFIAKLQNDSEDRLGYKHVRVIHSFSLGSNQSFTDFKNLSPSQWLVEH